MKDGRKEESRVFFSISWVISSISYMVSAPPGKPQLWFWVSLEDPDFWALIMPPSYCPSSIKLGAASYCCNLWNSALDSMFSFSVLPFPREPILYIKFPLLEKPGMASVFLVREPDRSTSEVHIFQFLLYNPLPSGLFHIIYDLGFRQQNSKHMGHVVFGTPPLCFTTAILYHCPVLQIGFFNDTLSRYTFKNNSLCILFRTRTLGALNVETPLVRLFLQALAELWKLRFRASPPERDFRGK